MEKMIEKFIKHYKKTLLFFSVIAVISALVFVIYPNKSKETIDIEKSIETESIIEEDVYANEYKVKTTEEGENISDEEINSNNEEKGEKQFSENITEYETEEQIQDIEAVNVVEEQEIQLQEEEINKLQCTISVSCDTINKNKDKLKREKQGIIPSDGWILEPETVGFNDGDSVFDVLRDTLKDKKIHMEFVETPAFNTVYIEGIANIYEFDCGELSGWEYRINGEFPGTGSSTVAVSDGDIIEFLYTCDLGKDIGAKTFD